MSSASKISYSEERYLIITADDFGASKNINEGIALAADKNVITTISALTNFRESLPDLKQIAEKHPHIGIGVHLNITTGKPIISPEKVPSLVDSEGNFYTMNVLLTRLKNISIGELEQELRAQILAFSAYNIDIDHFSDQHGIVSFYNPFFEIIMKLAAEYKVPVRSPKIGAANYPEIFTNMQITEHRRKTAFHLTAAHPFKAIDLLKYAKVEEMEAKAQKLDYLGIVHPDFLIVSFWGEPTKKNFLHIIENLPEGTSELVVHIGTSTRETNYPSGLDTNYFNNREQELHTICSDYIQEHISYLNIKPVGYAEMFKK